MFLNSQIPNIMTLSVNAILTLQSMPSSYTVSLSNVTSDISQVLKTSGLSSLPSLSVKICYSLFDAKIQDIHRMQRNQQRDQEVMHYDPRQRIKKVQRTPSKMLPLGPKTACMHRPARTAATRSSWSLLVQSLAATRLRIFYPGPRRWTQRSDNHCAFCALAAFLSLRLLAASGPLSVSRT